MRRIIINLDELKSDDQKNSMIQAAFNQDFVNFKVSGKIGEKLVKIQRCTVYSNDLTIHGIIPILKQEEKDQITVFLEKSTIFGLFLDISSKEQENIAVSLAKQGTSFIICKHTNWKVIPFENLIAKFSSMDCEIYADVGSSLIDAELLLHTLEIGVDGLIFSPNSENDLIELKQLLKTSKPLKLVSATIKKITSIPEADRVCVDTSSILKPGEGMLVGNTAMGFILVHAEIFDSEFVKSRPFRVNAGDVSEYILVPADDSEISIENLTRTQTKYLSELQSGDKVLVVDNQGNSRIVFVGRVKIETRPMLLIDLEVLKEEKQNQKTVSLKVTLQNAETVMVISTDGLPISVPKLNVGDKILVNLGPGATHFGIKIKEQIIEK
ncbi:MAG: 3-dehydroquinate synthase II [Promethearchaeota archaeon]